MLNAETESYEYHGFCTARLPDYRKCKNFEEHEVGQGICKYLLFGGACDWGQKQTVPARGRSKKNEN